MGVSRGGTGGGGWAEKGKDVQSITTTVFFPSSVLSWEVEERISIFDIVAVRWPGGEVERRCGVVGSASWRAWMDESWELQRGRR